jgi:hypothetical protein
VTSSNVLGARDAKFLYAIGATGTNAGAQHDPQGQQGAGLAPALGGTLPTSELTAIGGLANVLGPTGTDHGLGAGTADVTPHGAGSVAGLEDSNRPDLQNLLRPHDH